MSPRTDSAELRSKRSAYLAGAASALALVAIGLWLFAPRPVPAPGGPVNIVQASAPAPVPTATVPAAPRSYRSAVEKAAPSVVNVYTAQRPPRNAPRYDDEIAVALANSKVDEARVVGTATRSASGRP
jgi:S1-C subfamily serine protease